MILRYLRWRLGTAYGTYTPAGRERSTFTLLLDAARDWRNVLRFFRWARKMRR